MPWVPHTALLLQARLGAGWGASSNGISRHQQSPKAAEFAPAARTGPQVDKQRTAMHDSIFHGLFGGEGAPGCVRAMLGRAVGQTADGSPAPAWPF